ncbi:conserved hypothetical protein [Desulfamplus magnetovallimortis]|uniref:Uncharacterized protein n=2 Tax=Desulfamplus magnetovallimortis TaxID=1246637 RepID=A0A1W1HLP6_9BACT|nr:conserved hypothetical protein [Desulfamplus magnetovallimortis]
MCCLTFENETYRSLKSNLPKPGKKIETPMGAGKIIRQNILKESVVVKLDDGTEVEVEKNGKPYEYK